MSNYCVKCGAPLEPSFMFCVECGEPVHEPLQNNNDNTFHVSADKQTKVARFLDLMGCDITWNELSLMLGMSVSDISDRR